MLSLPIPQAGIKRNSIPRTVGCAAGETVVFYWQKGVVVIWIVMLPEQPFGGCGKKKG